MAAGKVQKFDPKAFDKMRGDIKYDQAQAKRVASLRPAPAPVKPPADAMKTGPAFGLASRKKMANQLAAGKGDPNGVKGKSMELGGGGRAAKLKAEGVPGPVIGAIARKKGVFGHMDFKKGPGKGALPKGKGDPGGAKGKKNCY